MSRLLHDSFESVTVVSVTGIPTAEAFGTPQVNMSVALTGIASAEAFGTTSVSSAQTVSPTAIASAEAFGTPSINMSVSVTGIASAEAFGTPVVAGPVTVTAIASAEAFGTTQVNMSVSLTGIASAEAFGTASVAAVVSLTGIASAEAFGTPQINMQVQPASTASAEAFGAFVAAGPVTVTAIASAEAFGTASVNMSVTLTGIATAEAFGTPSVTPVVSAGGIASAEAFGTPQINMSVSVTAIASAEAFGSPSVSYVVALTGIASAEAFGTTSVHMQVQPSSIASAEAVGTPSLAFVVYPTGIPSAEAFGTPSLSYRVELFGIASGEAFGTPVVSGPILLTGIASAEAFGSFSIQNFGALAVLGAPSSDIVGGGDVLVVGANLNMAPAEDDFADGVVSGLWTVVTTGTGSVVEAGGRLNFDTRTTVGSAAGVRTVATVGNVDVEVSFAPRTADVTRTGVVLAASFGLRVSASTEFRLDIQHSADANILRVVARRNGVTEAQQTLVTLPPRGLPAPVTLRIIRAGSRVLGLVSGIKMYDAQWVDTAANIEMKIENDASLVSRAATAVSAYRRYAAVNVGGEPVLTYLTRAPGHVIFDAPPAVQPGSVGVVSVGYAGAMETASGSVLYTIGDRTVVGRDATHQLVLLNDPAVRG